MIYNIVDFGAKDDERICTKQIQNAIDKCFLEGGGEVVIPSGRFVTGGLRLRSNVTLHLKENSALLGNTSPEDYFTYLEDEIEPINAEEQNPILFEYASKLPELEKETLNPYSRVNNAVIRAINAKNIAIIGDKNSIIDGHDELGEESYRGPRGINMWYCENIEFFGYTMKDTGNWGHALQSCRSISVKAITVLAGHDGFDMKTCDDVNIESCTFCTGDDAIAGFDNINITVRNSILNSSCSAMRLGGTNILVENCTSEAPNKYGFRGSLTMEQKKARAATDDNCRNNCLNAFLYFCDYRAKIRKTPGNILIKNCKFTNVDSVFSLSFGSRWACNKSLESITFENCIFEDVLLPMN